MTTIEQAAAQMELKQGASGLLRADMQPHQAVQALLDGGHTGEAVKLVARLLPKRYVVAWVCQCAREEDLPMEDRAGASLADKWTRDPSENSRRAAYDFAEADEYETLGGWIAATAGWAAGSLAPADQETAVPPPEHLTAVAAVAAINMLAALVPEKYAPRRRRFVQRAMTLMEQTGKGHEGTAGPP